MDAVSGLLDGPRADGAFLLRALMRSPWSVRVQDEAPLSIVAMTSGSAWMIPVDGEPIRVEQGDVAIIATPTPYVFSDDPSTKPQVVIHPGQICTTVGGDPVKPMGDIGVRTWGNDPDGPTAMLIGSYQVGRTTGDRLLRALPPFAVLQARQWDARLLDLLGEEVVQDHPGQEVVLDRLLDVLLVSVVRSWFASPSAAPPGWYRAYGDPVIGRVMRMINERPEHPWTVASLAGESGVSRAAFARRFVDVVGEPPMKYLTERRLDLAADLLRDPELTIGAVAHRVGYASAFAFSSAFKRVRGRTPAAVRHP